MEFFPQAFHASRTREGGVNAVKEKIPERDASRTREGGVAANLVVEKIPQRIAHARGWGN